MVVTRKKNGRVSKRRMRGDPDVDSVACPLGLLGAGLKKHPDVVVEIGDGNVARRRECT